MHPCVAGCLSDGIGLSRVARLSNEHLPGSYILFISPSMATNGLRVTRTASGVADIIAILLLTKRLLERVVKTNLIRYLPWQ